MNLNRSALTALRERDGLSQAELARRSGVSQSHISELESGEKRARPTTVKRLADALVVPVSALISEEAS